MIRHMVLVVLILSGLSVLGQSSKVGIDDHPGPAVIYDNSVVQEAWGTEVNGGEEIDFIAEVKLMLEMEKELDVYHYGEVYGCSCTTLTDEGKDVGFSNGVDPFCNKRAKQMWPQSKQQYVAVCGWAKLPLNTPVNTIEDDLSGCTKKNCELPPIKPPLAREDEVYSGSQRWGDGSVQFVQGMGNSGTLLPWTSASVPDFNQAAQRAADETDGKHLHCQTNITTGDITPKECAAEPIDVPAVQEVKNERVDNCTPASDGLMGCWCAVYETGCADKSRILLPPDGNGKHWCHKVQP